MVQSIFEELNLQVFVAQEESRKSLIFNIPVTFSEVSDFVFCENFVDLLRRWMLVENWLDRRRKSEPIVEIVFLEILDKEKFVEISWIRQWNLTTYSIREQHEGHEKAWIFKAISIDNVVIKFLAFFFENLRFVAAFESFDCVFVKQSSVTREKVSRCFEVTES